MKQLRQQLLLGFVTASVAIYSACANGGELVPDFRISAASDKFDDTYQLAVAYHLPAPGKLSIRHMELAVGTMAANQGNEAFVSLGPVWHWPLADRRMFVDIGISPTLFSGSTFNGRDLGGNFHFTSSLSIAATFGRTNRATISLRIQHTSNGGLDGTNPGMDMVGLNFSFVAER